MKVINFSEYESIVGIMASRLLPEGFDVTEDGNLCDSLEKITEYYRLNKRLLIWSGASDGTVFRDPSSNLAFRAWHDLIHVLHQLPFTQEGERQVCSIQQIQVLEKLSKIFSEKSLKLACLILDAEVNGQAEYFHNMGSFPEDQKTFTSNYVKQKLT